MGKGKSNGKANSASKDIGTAVVSNGSAVALSANDNDAAGIQELSWAEFNDTLLKTEEEAQLHSWIDTLIHRSHSVTRALRVHGRLNRVRAERERGEIRRAFNVVRRNG